MSRGKLKVYGTNTFLLAGRQARTIAAVSNQKEFAARIESTRGYVRNYACETGNETEIALAMSDPGTVFILCPTCEQWHKYQPRPR